MNDDFKRPVGEYNTRRKTFETYRNYARGNHQLRFIDKDFRTSDGNEFKSLRENLCGTIVSSFVDRLKVSAWGSKENDAIAKSAFLTSALKASWTEAFRCGHGFIIASRLPSGEIVPITQRAAQILVEADELNPFELSRAFRFWLDHEGDPRITVYDARAVTDYKASRAFERKDNGGFAAEDFPTDGYMVETPARAHGFDRVPIVQFRQSSENAWDDGVSILEDLIPLQDGLNQSLANMLVLSNSYARPFWYLLNYRPEGGTQSPRESARLLAEALGQATPNVPAAPTKDGSSFDRTKQRIFTTDSPGPFGQLDPPDISKLLDVQDRFALKMARVAGLPSYYLTQTQGDTPSGASLRILSFRMTSRVENFQADATRSLVRLGELFGMKDVAVEWVSAAPTDETETLNSAVTKYKQLGYALSDAIAGLDEPDAEGIVERATATAAPPRGGLFD